MTSDGKPYGPVKYKSLVEECYLISKHCYMPYSDVLDMSYIERMYITQFITEDLKKHNEAVEKSLENINKTMKK